MNSANAFNKLEITKGSKVLFIYPHPDDETYYSFGLISSSLKIDANVKIVCLTKGGASTLRYGVKNIDELMDVRTDEFNKVMRLLKTESESELLDYPDGKLNEMEDELYHYVEKLQAKENFTHIVTFEPNGGYGHKDHILISKIATEIYEKEKNFSLIYVTYGKLANKLQKHNSITPNVKLSLSLGSYLKKLRAISYYHSQFSPAYKPKHILLRLFAKNEYFYVCD